MGCGCKKGGVHKISSVHSCGTVEVRYLGALPFVVIAVPSGQRYKWTPEKTVRPVYECDFASIQAQSGNLMEVVSKELVGVEFPKEPEAKLEEEVVDAGE